LPSPAHATHRATVPRLAFPVYLSHRPARDSGKRYVHLGPGKLPEPSSTLIVPGEQVLVQRGGLPGFFAVSHLRSLSLRVRCVLESLALKYRWVLEKLEHIIGHRLEPIHIIGGGTRNRLLDQFAANATGRHVITGPVEATALGNILMQAVALGDIGSVLDARALVRRSSAPELYEPEDRSGWDESYQALLNRMTEAL
jgi:sugar (pentulose or hexulose) kinase